MMGNDFAALDRLLKQEDEEPVPSTNPVRYVVAKLCHSSVAEHFWRPGTRSWKFRKQCTNWFVAVGVTVIYCLVF
jgi:hypothetical protein